MKKFLLSLTCALFIMGAFAQAPQSFKYQAVARDNTGNLITSKSVGLRISILKGSVSGASVYSETYSVQTNEYGLINLEIGKGSVVSGSFVDINWGTNTYFVKIEMDAAGGSSYSLMGTSQLLSVPYALYANKSGISISDHDTSATNELQNLSINGNSLTISKGNSVTLPSVPTFKQYTQEQIDTLTPSEGTIVYNKTAKKYIYSDDVSWWTMDKNCAIAAPVTNAGNNIFNSTQTTVTLNATPVKNGHWSAPSPEPGVDTDGSVNSTSNANTTFTGTACHKYKLSWMAESSCGDVSGDGLIISLGSAVGWVESENGLTINLNAIGTGTWSIFNGSGGNISNPNSAATTFTGVNGNMYTVRWTVTNATCGTTTHDITFGTKN